MSFEHVNKQLSTGERVQEYGQQSGTGFVCVGFDYDAKLHLDRKNFLFVLSVFGSVSNQINICHQIKANGVDMGF